MEQTTTSPESNKTCPCCARSLDAKEFLACKMYALEHFGKDYIPDIGTVCEICIEHTLYRKNTIDCSVFPVSNWNIPMRFEVGRGQWSDPTFGWTFSVPTHIYRLKHPKWFNSSQKHIIDSVFFLQEQVLPMFSGFVAMAFDMWKMDNNWIETVIFIPVGLLLFAMIPFAAIYYVFYVLCMLIFQLVMLTLFAAWDVLSFPFTKKDPEVTIVLLKNSVPILESHVCLPLFNRLLVTYADERSKFENIAEAESVDQVVEDR